MIKVNNDGELDTSLQHISHFLKKSSSVHNLNKVAGVCVQPRHYLLQCIKLIQSRTPEGV